MGKQRSRATAIVMRDGKCLVVRDRGRKNYSLPGGGIEHGEPALAAAAREVYEETQLEPKAARLLFHHRGATQHHHVVLVDAGPGTVRLQRKELDDYRWWDGKSNLPVHPHVREILARVRQQGLHH